MTGLQIRSLIFAVLMGFTVFVGVVIFYNYFTKDKRAVLRRLLKIRGRQNTIFDAIELEKERKSESIEERLGKRGATGQSKFVDRILNELVLAGIAMRPEEFALIWILLVFVPSGIAALFGQKIMPAATLAFLGAIAPVIYLSQKKKKRVAEFDSQLGDALMVITNCLRSGLSFQQSLETIVNEMSPPISSEFSRVLIEVKYGNPLEVALNNMVERLKSADLLIAISAVNIQRQTGGNLSEILETLANTIKERMRIKKEIKAITAQGRMSGLVVGLLPVGLTGILMVVAPDYITTLFTDPRGQIMIGIAAVMEMIGALFIKKIINIKY